MLRIKCLGQLTVVGEDGELLTGAASQPRRLAILALLARAGERGITREKIIGYLWPDSDDERARRLESTECLDDDVRLGGEHGCGIGRHGNIPGVAATVTIANEGGGHLDSPPARDACASSHR